MVDDCSDYSRDLEAASAEPNAGSKKPASVCPECGTAGKKVDSTTVKANLAVSLRRLEDAAYRFCSAEGCRVVYFSDDGLSIFRLDEVRERVYQKDPDDDVLVCYCFQHSVGALRSASSEQRAAIADDIVLGTRSGQCACELRNPQGSCCLGNVRELIERLDHP